MFGALGNVLHHTDISAGIVALSEDGPRNSIHPHGFALAVRISIALPKFFAARTCAVPTGEHAFAVVRMQNLLPTGARAFLGAKPSHRKPFLVEIQHLSVRAGAENSNRRGRCERAEHFLAFSKRPLRS